MAIMNKKELSERALEFMCSLMKIQAGIPLAFRPTMQIPVGLWPNKDPVTYHDMYFYNTLIQYATYVMIRQGYRQKNVIGDSRDDSFLTYDEVDFIRRELAPEEEHGIINHLFKQM
jgi:hypothetical protein